MADNREDGMSMHADDLRSVGGHLGELAAEEIDSLEMESAFLFAENKKLKDLIEEAARICEKSPDRYTAAAMIRDLLLNNSKESK